MLQYALKVIVSALVIVAVTEIAKRSTAFAALVASLPLTSLLAFVWLHFDGVPNDRIATLASEIFWLVLPSLALFLVFALLIHRGFAFWSSLAVSIGATAGCYLLMVPVLRRFGIVF